MQICISLKKCKPKVGLHTKYYVVCFFHYLRGNPELPCFNRWKNPDVNSYRKWITDMYLTFIPSSDIWDRPTSFLLDVFFCDLVQEVDRKQESTWLSITNWKIHSKVTLLPCIGKKHSTFIQNVYMRERESNMTCLLINMVFLIHAYHRKKKLFSCLS